MRLETVRWVRRLLLAVVILALLAAMAVIWQSTGAGGGPGVMLRLLGLPGSGPLRHIGIVAGHSGNDSGAVCPDGLTEAQVNRGVAEAVARTLRRRGATVDLLQEFDPSLSDFQADAFVSIHADSCEVDRSGYKVASLEGGSEASQRLADCLWEKYNIATGLEPDPDTVTYDMSRYHAFREISPQTPAAIIEIGFLKGDRRIIADRPDRAAQGIVAGIECFLGD
jgi:N-acetylmuramoyl-L-alanine amidase